MSNELIEFVCIKCGANYFTKGYIPEFQCNCSGRKFREKKIN